MSWPGWPQAATAAVAQPMPAPTATAPTVPLAAGVSSTASMNYPPPSASAAPQTYTAAQYAALTPEQQYALQQNWQQWQTYHQQYAQWHAQYGEQYQREMQAKLGAAAPSLPFVTPPAAQYTAPVPPTPVPAVAPAPVPPVPMAYTAPPPPPPDNKTLASAVGSALSSIASQPPPPPPPPEKDQAKSQPPLPVPMYSQPPPTQQYQQSSIKLPHMDVPPPNMAGWGGSNQATMPTPPRSQGYQENQQGQMGYQSNQPPPGFQPNQAPPGFQSNQAPPGFQNQNQQGYQNFQNQQGYQPDGSQGNQGGGFGRGRDQERGRRDEQNFNERRSFGGDRGRGQDRNRSRNSRDFGGGGDRNDFGDRRFNDNRMGNSLGGIDAWPQSNQSKPYGPNLPDQPQKLQQRSIESYMGDPADGKTPEERAFDEQFRKWEEEFERWKKQNANHPDRTAYREYEMKFEDCRRKLLERREQMRLRKLQQQQKAASNDISAKPLQPPPQINMDALGEMTEDATAPEPKLETEVQSRPQVDEPAKDESANKDQSDVIQPDMELSNDDPAGAEISQNESQSEEEHGFLKTTSVGGIPGLDLVPAADEEKREEKREEDTEVINLDDDENKTPGTGEEAGLDDQQKGESAQAQPPVSEDMASIPSLLTHTFAPPCRSPDAGSSLEPAERLVDSIDMTQKPPESDGPGFPSNIASVLANQNLLALLSAALGKNNAGNQVANQAGNTGFQGGSNGFPGGNSGLQSSNSPFQGGPGGFPGGNNRFPGDPGPFAGRDGPFQGRDGPFQGRDGPFQARDGPFQGRDGPFGGRPFGGIDSVFQGRDGPFSGRDGNFQGKDGPFQGRDGGDFRGGGFQGGNPRMDELPGRQGLSPWASGPGPFQNRNFGNFNNNPQNNMSPNNRNNMNNFQNQNRPSPWGGNQMDNRFNQNNQFRGNNNRWGNQSDDNRNQKTRNQSWQNQPNFGGGDGGDMRNDDRNANNQINDGNEKSNSRPSRWGEPKNIGSDNNPVPDGGPATARGRSNERRSRWGGNEQPASDSDERKTANPFDGQLSNNNDGDSGQFGDERISRGMNRRSDMQQKTGGSRDSSRQNPFRKSSVSSQDRDRSKSNDRRSDLSGRSGSERDDRKRFNPFKDSGPPSAIPRLDDICFFGRDLDDRHGSGGSNQMNQSAGGGRRNPFKQDMMGLDEYFKPTQVIDYQNRPLGSDNNQSGPGKFTSGKVVDYDHGGNRQNNRDNFYPVKTIDYGHSSSTDDGNKKTIQKDNEVHEVIDAEKKDDDQVEGEEQQEAETVDEIVDLADEDDGDDQEALQDAPEVIEEIDDDEENAEIVGEDDIDANDSENMDDAGGVADDGDEEVEDVEDDSTENAGKFGFNRNRQGNFNNNRGGDFNRGGDNNRGRNKRGENPFQRGGLGGGGGGNPGFGFNRGGNQNFGGMQGFGGNQRFGGNQGLGGNQGFGNQRFGGNQGFGGNQNFGGNQGYRGGGNRGMQGGMGGNNFGRDDFQGGNNFRRNRNRSGDLNDDIYLSESEPNRHQEFENNNFNDLNQWNQANDQRFHQEYDSRSENFRYSESEHRQIFNEGYNNCQDSRLLSQSCETISDDSGNHKEPFKNRFAEGLNDAFGRNSMNFLNAPNQQTSSFGFEQRAIPPPPPPFIRIGCDDRTLSERDNSNFNETPRSSMHSANSDKNPSATSTFRQEQDSVVSSRTTIENTNTISIDEILLKPGRDSRPKKIAMILRGAPGSGKTYVAKLIKEKEVAMGGSAPRILSIDDYFMIESDREEKCPKTGRKIINKEMIYEYEKEMEKAYNDSLYKTFKKTTETGLFDFIIVDNINNTIAGFLEFYNSAKSAHFTPYVIDLKSDLESCLSNNIHNRSREDIENILKNWSETPNSIMKLDITSLLQSDAITEVEMEDVSDTEEQTNIQDNAEENRDAVNDEDSQDDTQTFGFLKSKWETDNAESKLARLDGVSKPLHKSATLEDYLQMDGWEPPPSSSTNKKRVRWADIEEKRAQDKMRAIGFVVGQTDWNRMLDPTGGQSALTKTKYIEKIKKY